MPVVCPYCQHPMNVKGARPGRYTPKCGKCGKAFSLTVSSDAEQSMSVAPLSTAPRPTAAKSAVGPKPAPPSGKTAPDPLRPAAEKKAAPPKPKAPPPPEPAADATGVFEDPSAPPSPGLDATGFGDPGADNADFSLSPPAPNLDATLADNPDASADFNPDATTADPNSVADASPARHDVTDALGATMADGEEEADAPKEKADESSDGEMPESLGGYQVVKTLGRGGMGAVYLARQISLDRNVALKVMNPQWAKNPTFMARFTREAYAAAQLVHHNVVQVYDIGEDRGISYFSMEYVEGQSLQDLLKKEGKLDPEMAAGYVLQAARGLKFAHDRGMIHRDIKPDNLMLNTEGIVKVADLGLVRTPGAVETPPDPNAEEPPPPPPVKGGTRPSLASLSNITMAHQAMGTPAYMPPEQARDATKVDHRADIYSLGCTLYVLVSGRAPFSGRTALEIMSKHAKEPLVPPEVIVQRIPKQLSAIVVKMMAKKPDDRYADMGEVVKALEDFLGVQAAGKFSPREEHAQALETSLKQFNDASGVTARNWFFPGFLGGCAVLFLLLTLMGWWYVAGGFLGLGVLTAVAYFILDGVRNKTVLFLKVREYLLDSSWTDWLTWVGGLLFFLLILWFVGLLVVWVGVVIIAVALAAGFHFLIDRPLEAQRREPLEAINKLLRELRLKGLDEEALRQFVCKYSGERWEEFYEALFGYEAKLEARARWGKGLTGRPREKFGAWRDPIVSWIDARSRARQEARERRHLQLIEQKNLQAQGMSEQEARQKAERAADVMVQAAAEVKAEVKPTPTAPPQQDVTLAENVEALARERANEEILRRRVEALLHAADDEDKEDVRAAQKAASFNRTAGAFFGIFLGVRPRVLLGLVLLCGFLFWLHWNKMMPGSNPEVNLSNLTWVWKTLEEKTGVLEVPLLPSLLTAPFASVNAGVAGLILVLSIFCSGNRIGLFLMPAAFIMVLGPMVGVPSLATLSPHLVSLAVGGGLAALGYLFGRLPTE